MAVWAVALIWTLGYCTITSDTPSYRTSIILGMPSWVFYGVAVPAMVCTVVTMLFGLFGMADDDMGEEPAK